MKTRTLLLIAIALAGFCLASASQAQTTVRGQLLRNGQSPAAGIQVTLYSPTFGRSSPAVTGPDGMYYLYNVPYGNYYLEIWLSNPPRAYPAQVGRYPYNDLPQIAVP